MPCSPNGSLPSLIMTCAAGVSHGMAQVVVAWRELLSQHGQQAGGQATDGMPCHVRPVGWCEVWPTRHASAPCSHLWVQLQRHVQQQHVVLGDGAVVHHDGLRGRGSGRPGRLVRSGKGLSRMVSVCRQDAIALDRGAQAAGGDWCQNRDLKPNEACLACLLAAPLHGLTPCLNSPWLTALRGTGKSHTTRPWGSSHPYQPEREGCA